MHDLDNAVDTKTGLGISGDALRNAQLATRSQSVQQMMNAMTGLIAAHQIVLLKLEVIQRLLVISNPQMKALVEELANDEEFAPNISELIAFYKAQQGVSLHRLTNPNERSTGEGVRSDPARQPMLPFNEGAVGVTPS